MKKVMILAVIAAVAMAGCSKENNTSENGDNQIRFSSGVLSVNTKAALGDAATTLPAGETIGILAVKHTGTMTWPAALTGYHANLQNAQGTVDVTDQTKISYSPLAYYPQSVASERLNFYAYYPYAASVTVSGSAPTIAISQPTDPAGHVDYLWAAPVVNQSRQATAVPLAFNHAMGLVRVMIQKNILMTDALELQSITLTTSRPQSGTMNIETGGITLTTGGSTVYTLGGLTTTVPAQTGTTTTAAVIGGTDARFLYIPASIITDVSVTVNGTVYAVTGQNIATPAAGTAINLFITIQPTEIIFTASVAAWTDGTDTQITPK